MSQKSWKSHGNLLVKMCTNPVNCGMHNLDLAQNNWYSPLHSLNICTILTFFCNVSFHRVLKDGPANPVYCKCLSLYKVDFKATPIMLVIMLVCLLGATF